MQIDFFSFCFSVVDGYDDDGDNDTHAEPIDIAQPQATFTLFQIINYKLNILAEVSARTHADIHGKCLFS